jgi:hypothetical protein
MAGWCRFLNVTFSIFCCLVIVALPCPVFVFVFVLLALHLFYLYLILISLLPCLYLCLASQLSLSHLDLVFTLPLSCLELILVTSCFLSKVVISKMLPHAMSMKYETNTWFLNFHRKRRFFHPNPDPHSNKTQPLHPL